MAYVDIYDAATNVAHVIRKQATVAVQHAAADVVVEDPETPNHAERLTWARRARQDPVTATAEILWRAIEVAGNVDLTTREDAQVQTVVDGLVDEFATG